MPTVQVLVEPLPVDDETVLVNQWLLEFHLMIYLSFSFVEYNF
jgi:hypothetical protein